MVELMAGFLKFARYLVGLFARSGLMAAGSWFVNRLVIWLVDSRLISSLLDDDDDDERIVLQQHID